MSDPTRGRGRLVVRAGLAVAVAGVVVVTAAPQSQGAGGDGVPVEGSLTATIHRSPQKPPGTMVLHGVRRIDGGTVVYYSLSTAPGGASGVTFADVATPGLVFSYTQYTGKVALTDGRNAYLPLVYDDAVLGQTAITTRYTGNGMVANAFYTAYVVLPELPADVSTVDVLLGDVGVIPGVPVTDGLLTPTVDGSRPVPLGTYWPAVDPAKVAAARTAGTVVPLEKTVADLERAVTTREKGDAGSVDLSADVLFAVDQATLTPRATAKLQAAVRTVNEKAAGGRITITGHTDSTGTPAHNLDLSRRRAAAVAAALRPLITVSGVTYVVEGKGETQPIAPNSTADGRQANRRVSIGFTVKES
jgi:outer membrane protein OmpA-like peptidoglycan-associated protein